MPFINPKRYTTKTTDQCWERENTNETEQSGPKSEYTQSQARSGALLASLQMVLRKNSGFHKLYLSLAVSDHLSSVCSDSGFRVGSKIFKKYWKYVFWSVYGFRISYEYLQCYKLLSYRPLKQILKTIKTRGHLGGGFIIYR